ncbi:hypothetical protein [Aureimonas sp. AU20]|uniref:hypothetical protein n=1 Tax=Aureimonas sp. AU20 TaxID=1349819 RepID=UPI00071ED8AD|nr:hypothetical protein [Aureimonas sp. AU20]ALN72518.1 hypothetical protein M673_07320 [Aureimonas sp. AU20]
MRFAPVALVVGFAGTILASYLQGPAVASTDSLVAAMSPSPEITASIAADAQGADAEALRLIDLRNGASCKVNGPVDSDGPHRLPIGPACAKSPDLARVAYWETKNDGSLVMTDHQGETVLEFMPGDGVLYESVYPSNALITIVPARS